MIKKICIIAGLLFLFGVCEGNSYDIKAERNKAKIIRTSETVAKKEPYGAIRLDADVRRLQAFSRELNEQLKEMYYLQKSVGLKKRGHYTSDEHDKIESLLFRYLMVREGLWDLVSFYSNYKDNFSEPELQTKGFIIAFNAALHLSCYSSRMVAIFHDEEAVIHKLNEEYFRSSIPRGTYDRIFDSVTSVKNLKALKASWILYSDDVVDPDSRLNQVSRTEPVYRDLLDQIDKLYTDTAIQTEYILEKRSVFFPRIRNRLRQASIVNLAKDTKESFDDNLYAARSILFENVSRIKLPLTGSIILFSDDQLREIKSLLLPGDIILTFTSGYMSNIFLPGQFKHGITYVGFPSERKEIGLTEKNIKNISAVKRKKILSDISISHLPSGENADLIESVAEGVIFNSLDHIAATHINRLVVLRPRISKQERIKQLQTTFLLLGDSYDFKFDFDDGSSQCCTEVIYRALHAKGSIRFPLTQRMGIQTLSADDIIHYYFQSPSKIFDFVLLAEEDIHSKDNRAVVLIGKKGEQRLQSLMNAEQ